MVPRAHPAARLRGVAVVVVTGVALGACAPKYYVPNTHNVPLLEGAGDFSASFVTGDSRAELQGAYAVSDKVGLTASLSCFEQEADSLGNGGRGGIAEIGVGFQRPLSDGLSFALYGLLGGGDVENHFPSTVGANPGTTGMLEGRLRRYGLQPVLGFRSRHFQIAASTRVVGLYYSAIGGSLFFAGDDQVAYLRSRDSHLLVEPALTLRAGLEAVMLQVQLGRSFNLRDSNFRQDDGHLSVGVVYSPRQRER